MCNNWRKLENLLYSGNCQSVLMQCGGKLLTSIGCSSYVGQTLRKCITYVGPTLANHVIYVVPTLANHVIYVGPTLANNVIYVGPMLVQRWPNVDIMSSL